MAQRKETLTLCGVCYKQFKDIPNRKIIPLKRITLDTCTYCNVRNGYDYIIITVKKKG